MRTVLIILCSLIFGTRISYGAIEVYAAGKYFRSFEEYKKSRERALLGNMKLAGPVSEHQQAPFISGQVQKEWDKIGYNSGVHHVVVDFQQNWQNPKPRFIVDADQLQGAIREAMENRQEATLLISDPKKMRILSYATQKNPSANPDIEDRQRP